MERLSSNRCVEHRSWEELGADRLGGVARFELREGSNADAEALAQWEPETAERSGRSVMGHGRPSKLRDRIARREEERDIEPNANNARCPMVVRQWALSRENRS
jgi:hypothetical protein